MFDPEGLGGMRILIVSQYFYPENFRVNQLATALREGGHDIVVLTGQPNYPSGRFFPGYGAIRPQTEHWDGIEIIRVPILARGAGRRWQLALNYLSFAISATILGLPKARGTFDACIAFCPSPITTTIPAIVQRWCRKTPVAIWLQDLWPETVLALTRTRSRVMKGALDVLVRWIYRRVDQIWIQSPAYAESVAAHGGRADQIVYVPNWAEDLYDCSRWADIAGEPLPPNSIVYAGNFGRSQGLDTIIDAADRVRTIAPPVHWVLVGDGLLGEWLRTEVRDRSLERNVTIMSRREPQDMPALLKGAAALLVTLANEPVFTQTIPSKLQSCFASGRPVIASLAGESARLIEEAKCGIVCAPQDAVALANAARDIAAMPDADRDNLGRKAHAYYQAYFTQTRIIATIADLLQAMTGRAAADRQISRQTNRAAGD
jgi:colanic acid biosynthesis glycosyl transferase WcaI